MRSSISKGIRLATTISGLALGGALAIGAAPAFAAAGPAAAHGVRPMTSYSNMYNDASGKCLGTAGGHNNADAILWTCNGTRNQGWRQGSFNPSNGNYYQLINENGDCLGVAGGSTSNGAHIMGWRCQGSSAPNQYWQLNCQQASGSDGNGCVFVNLTTPCNDIGMGGKVIGVGGGSVSNGAPIVLWTNSAGPNFSPNQAWYWLGQ